MRSVLPALLAVLMGSALSAAAHVGAPPASARLSGVPVAAVQQVHLVPVDRASEIAADHQAGHPLPLRFAVPRAVALSTTNSGTWEQIPGGRLWRLRVTAPGATDLNFGFTQFWLPEGATLHVTSEATGDYQGPYTSANHNPDGELWTPAIPGQAGILELYLPAAVTAEPRLLLTQISAGYRDLFAQANDGITPMAASCEMDVACPPAAPWTNEIRSVARIQISGTRFCTGTLVMNTARDFRAFFLTANHCGIAATNASSVVVYWNDQSPACGQYGVGGTLLQNQTGASIRAARADVDFCLIELNQTPSGPYRVYYSGWDRSGATAAGGVGIHHPNADGKCISFSTNSLLTSNSFWQVTWSSGVTENGSSGSGIWDSATHKLVGFLSSGLSSCSTPTAADYYGKFAVAWAGGNSPTNRLRDWLDPLGTGVTTLAGADPSPMITRLTVTNQLAQLTVQSPSSISNQIQFSTNLASGQWSSLTNLLVSQSVYQVNDPNPATAVRRFYRVAETTTFYTVTMRQLWGSTRTNLTTTAIQKTGLATPVNTAAASFDAAHTTLWIPVSYVPEWPVGTVVYWGSTLYSMKVMAVGSGQIQFRSLSGYFGWGAGNVIAPSLSYPLSTALTAATRWQSPGVGSAVVVTANSVSANVGDIVWVGGVGADQFQILAITQ